jgi:hypothetical protein
MNTDLISVIGKYLVALVALVGCLLLVSTAPSGTNTAEDFTVIGLIVGWIVRDSAGQSATVNAVKTIAAVNSPAA